MIHNMVFAKIKRSTEHALLDIINQIETNLGGELYSCGIFYLQKAFDTVCHKILPNLKVNCIIMECEK